MKKAKPVREKMSIKDFVCFRTEQNSPIYIESWLKSKKGILSYTPLYNRLIIYNSQLINVFFRLTQLQFPVKLPAVSLSHCIEIRN